MLAVTDGSDIFAKIGESIPAIVDWVAIAIFMVGFLRTVPAWLRCELTREVDARARHRHMQVIRLALGNYILLGLEVMIISDVIHSCRHPDLMSLAELGALVLVRTFISYFLGKELEHVHVDGEPAPPRE